VQVMYAGRLVERGAAHDILRAPAHPYTEALIRSAPRADRLTRGRLPTIPGVPPNLMEIAPGCSFEPRCPRGNRDERCLHERPEVHYVDGVHGPLMAECHYPLEDRGA
jgi:oligopeptide/dipeptide ABC transporter ATP-binding protein